MARFNPTRFPPGFFDLPSDAGQSLPLDIIAAWTRSDQSREAARELLAPCTLRGIVVATDCAGLTRLSTERSLIEILALVSRPKELIHAYGRAIGGQPLGLWAADNTLMFYPAGVSPDHVVSLLLALLDRVREECEVGVGVCVHAGEFYELGNGLYGPDADRVEAVAEDHTAADELLLTDVLAQRLGETARFTLEPRDDLRERFGPIFRVVAGPRLGGVEASDFHYPLPFTDEFFTGLHEFQRTRRTSVVPRPAYREGAIVVIEQEREDRDIPELAALNDLALAAGLKRLGNALLGEHQGTEVKTTTGFGIYHFLEARHALGFARAVREALAAQGVQVRVGIDVGRVLVFELGPGLRDAAGSPVNVASKLAQDVGRFGVIQLTAQAARLAGLADVTAARTLRLGGLSLEVVAVE